MKISTRKSDFNNFDRIFITRSEWAWGLYVSNELEIKHINKPSFESYDVTDCKARGVADPFLIEYNGEIYIFFEIEKYVNKKTTKGVIGCAKLIDNKIEYLGIVLEENFHLSFPFLLKYNDEIFMMPESSASNKLYLYKCIEFPFKWEKYKLLLEGNFIDSILFYSNKGWNLLTSKDHKYTNLYISESLEDKFSFIKTLYIDNKAIGRNGGFVKDLRVAQDCSTAYGERVHFFKYSNEKEEYFATFNTSCGYKWDSINLHHFNVIEFKGKFYHVYDAKGYQSRIRRFLKRNF